MHTYIITTMVICMKMIAFRVITSNHKIFMRCGRAMDRFALFLIYDNRFDEIIIELLAYICVYMYVQHLEFNCNPIESFNGIFYSALHLFQHIIMAPMIMIDFTICQVQCSVFFFPSSTCYKHPNYNHIVRAMFSNDDSFFFSFSIHRIKIS